MLSTAVWVLSSAAVSLGALKSVSGVVSLLVTV